MKTFNKTIILSGLFTALCFAFILFPASAQAMSYDYSGSFEGSYGTYQTPTPPTPPYIPASQETETDIPPGGGHEMILGNMNLEIIKFISLDGEHYFPAATTDNALIIPENKTSRVYVKVSVTNKGIVTAANIHLAHNFDPALSDMELDSFEITGGLNGNVEYNEKKKEIRIGSLPVEQSVSFTYTLIINEKGQTDERAEDALLLTEYGSNLPITQDGLTYGNTGDSYSNYLVAGIGNAAGQPFSSGMGSGMGADGTVITREMMLPNMLPSTGSGMWAVLLVTGMLYAGRLTLWRYRN